jgi:hypothetical protein
VVQPVQAQEEQIEEEEVEEEVEEPVEEEWEEEENDEEFDDAGEGDPEATTDPNPLNPAGDSLDKLIELRMNDDMWAAMLGELPCLEATETCLTQLQGMAVSNSLALQAIDQRVELINEKIEEARANNQRTIRLGVFEPAVTAFLNIESIAARPAVTDAQGNIITSAQPAQRRGFLDRILMFFENPIRGLNDIFSLVGIPLLRTISGGDQATQERTLAITDLQVKVAEIENKRGEIAQGMREQTILHVLDFDQIRREFQVSQEIARRSQLQFKIREVAYRLGAGGDTQQYLNDLSALDRQKAEAFRSWARLRSQLVRCKVLILGSEEI